MAARILRIDGTTVPLLWSINAGVLIVTAIICVIVAIIAATTYGYSPVVAIVIIFLLGCSIMLCIVIAIIYIQVKMIKEQPLEGTVRLQNLDDDHYLEPQSDVHVTPPSALPAQGTQVAPASGQLQHT